MSFYESAADENTSGLSLCALLFFVISGVSQARKRLIWLGCSSNIILVTALVTLEAALLGFSSFFFFFFFFLVGKGVTPCPSVEHHPWREEAEFARLTPVTLAAISLPGSVMKRLEIRPSAPTPPPPPSPLPTTTSEADQTIGMFWRANVKLLLP